MLKLIGGSSAYTKQALTGNFNNIVLPSVTIKKKSIFNTASSGGSYITSRSGEKIKYQSDTCVTEGEVECIVCPKRFDISQNTGIILSVEICGINNDSLTVTTTLVTCSHNCSARFLIEEEKKGYGMREEFKNSLTYHRLIHSIQNPRGGVLMPSGDVSLLRTYGGSMSFEDWKRDSSSLQRTPVMNVVHMKSSHIKY